jgi:hypothetical protein
VLKEVVPYELIEPGRRGIIVQSGEPTSIEMAPNEPPKGDPNEKTIGGNRCGADIYGRIDNERVGAKTNG